MTFSQHEWKDCALALCIIRNISMLIFCIFLSPFNMQIDYIHPKAFENLGELMVLDLSNNHLSFNQGQGPPIVGRSAISNYFSSTPGIMDEGSGLDEFGTLFQNCRLERLNLRNNLITKGIIQAFLAFFLLTDY